MHTRDIVAVGSSLGGVDATGQLLAALPADFPAAILVVLHVGANGKNLLADIFSSRSRLPIHTAKEGMRITRGCVYVAPADHHLIVVDEIVRLGHGPRENMSRPAIDPTFRSVALTYGPRAIGVILTGLLNDGSAGLADIKRCGGIAVVQNPREAVAADMPLGALAATEVDYRTSLSELPELLLTLVAQPAESKQPPPPDIAIEVDIALGGTSDADVIKRVADPTTYSCPTCGGVLSEMRRRPPLRFRCQVGHAFTAETLMSSKEGSADEAMRLALRVLDERAHLSAQIARDARTHGRVAAARAHDSTAEQARESARVIREAMLKSAD
jgi:two-component system chemotaxis response regulator CheB